LVPPPPAHQLGKREGTGHTELTVLEQLRPKAAATRRPLATASGPSILVLTSSACATRQRLLASMELAREAVIDSKPSAIKTLPPKQVLQPVSWPGQAKQPLPHRPSDLARSGDDRVVSFVA